VFWAGASHVDRTSGAFKVLANGNLSVNNASVTNTLNARDVYLDAGGLSISNLSVTQFSVSSSGNVMVRDTLTSDRINTTGGVHVGGTSDPGTDNLIVDGNVTSAGNVVFSKEITPTELAANTDNWSPTNLATARYIRVSASVAVDLTGIVAALSGREIILWNGGSSTITIKNDATSTAANRFLTPGATDFALTQYKSVLIRYDGTSSRWIVLG
jgi:hypothetical protein